MHLTDAADKDAHPIACMRCLELRDDGDGGDDGGGDRAVHLPGGGRRGNQGGGRGRGRGRGLRRRRAGAGRGRGGRAGRGGLGGERVDPRQVPYVLGEVHHEGAAVAVAVA
jgi:hypothetical protein